MAEQCIFCDEFERGDNTFAETELWRARWDRYPATPGHVEVLPKRHVQYFDQLTGEERDSMMRFAHEMMQVIRKEDLVSLYTTMIQSADDTNRALQQKALDNLMARSDEPDAFNFGINDGPEAGQSIHHLHLHLMPRWEGDMANPRGGVRNLFQQDTYRNL